MSEYHPGLLAVCDQFHANASQAIRDLLDNPELQQALDDEGPAVVMMRVIKTLRADAAPQLVEFYLAAALVQLLEREAPSE